MADIVIMRVQCTCGRNLVDVVDWDYNEHLIWSVNEYLRKNGLNERAWRREDVYLQVYKRPNVRGERPHPIQPGPRFGPMKQYLTYSWQCRCGQNWKRTAEKIALAWDRTGPDAPPGRPKGTVVAVLDVDL